LCILEYSIVIEEIYELKITVIVGFLSGVMVSKRENAVPEASSKKIKVLLYCSIFDHIAWPT
jgi:hypothetical protein